MKKELRYSIPIMGIQDVLVDLEARSEVEKMRKWVKHYVKTKSYLYPPPRVKWDSHLERAWYMEFSTDDRWLMQAFIKEFIRYI